MKLNQNELYDRQYYIDWLRIILISSVFLFHTGMVFVTWDWHVKNDVLYGGFLRYLMTFLHSWRMPLLFMISGAGTYYSVRRLSTAGYLAERTKRLLLPLAAGIFLLVPVQVYIERIDSYGSLLAYYPHMFEGIYPEGNFSWHHLWFIAYLYLLALLTAPFLNILKSAGTRRYTERIADTLAKPFGMNLVIIPLLLSQVILRNYFETGTNALVNDWASITYYMIFFMTGFLFLTQKKVADAMARYRNIYLAEAVLFTCVMFIIPGQAGSERTAEIIYDVSEILVSWTCAVCATGYARKYLNTDSHFRKEANEAIYPLYLLHQPLIVVTGYIVTQYEIADWLKAILIIDSSLLIFVFTYRYLIRPFNAVRILFGMKMKGNPVKPLKQNAAAAETGQKADRA